MSEQGSSIKELVRLTRKTERLEIIAIINRMEKDILEHAIDAKDALTTYAANDEFDLLEKLKKSINDMPLE